MEATALAVAVLAGAGCEVDPKGENSGPNPIFGGGIEDELDAVAMLDPEVYRKIGSCVESGQFKAFVGDPEWQRTWDEVGRSPAGLRAVCERLAANEPDTLDAIHAEWIVLDASTGE